MTTTTTELEVDVPVGVAYNQWTQFEKFPTFMEGVTEVRQLDDTTLEWCVEIAGVERSFVADILVQEPDQCIAWASRDCRDHAGSVSFESLEPDRTRIALRMEYEPANWTEMVADALNLIDARTRQDLRNFKEMVEARNGPTGAWRGSVIEGQVQRDPGLTPTAH